MSSGISLTLWDNLWQHYQEKNLTYKAGNKDGNVVCLTFGTKHFSAVRRRPFPVSEVEKVVRRGYISPSMKIGCLRWDSACASKTLKLKNSPVCISAPIAVSDHPGNALKGWQKPVLLFQNTYTWSDKSLPRLHWLNSEALCWRGM